MLDSKHSACWSLRTLPWPVPSPDRKRGGLGVGLAPPPRKKKKDCYRNADKRYRDYSPGRGGFFVSKTYDAMW